jgi:hydroxymethylpyrimidine/phosphomethylpyrimidine kinase
MIRSVLSIAGFDGSGGAGLQADIKTASALGCYSTNVLTAIAVQNTQGVRASYAIPSQAIQEQLEVIFEDIIPDCIKIGMLFNTAVIDVVADFLKLHAQSIPIVLDPVMVATSGDRLLQPDAKDQMIKKLFPLCTILTPNHDESLALLNEKDAWISKKIIGERLLQLVHGAVLIKGGHDTTIDAVDVLFQKNKAPVYFSSPRIHTKHTHGTGCTLSSAIASYIAKGEPLETACLFAKDYVTNAIVSGSAGLVGKGSGPLHHFYHYWKS